MIGSQRNQVRMDKSIRVLPKYSSTLAGVFLPSVISSLANKGHSQYLNDVLVSTGIINQIDPSMSFGEFFDTLYALIADSYRSEYVYKNVIANKILLGRHSLNTACMLTELRVGNCKADVVILNKTSTVYEIKSEFDSLERLDKQIASYAQVFDLVNIITSNGQLAKLEKAIPRTIGLIELTSTSTLRTVRKPLSLKNDVKPEVIFDTLRKPEYLTIISKAYGYVPDVPNTRIYTECRKLFGKLSPELAHDEMVNALKLRPNKQILARLVHNVPSSLTAYVLGAELSPCLADRLEELMHTSLSATLASI